VQFTLSYRESGPCLTIGAGLVEKRKWNTIFRLDISVGNFGLPGLKTLRLFGNQTTFSRHFFPSCDHTGSNDLGYRKLKAYCFRHSGSVHYIESVDPACFVICVWQINFE